MVEEAAAPLFLLGRCPEVLFKSRVTSHNNDTCSPLEKGRAKGAGWIHAAVRKTMWDYPFPLNVIPAEVEGSFLQTGKTWLRERRKRKHQGVV